MNSTAYFNGYMKVMRKVAQFTAAPTTDARYYAVNKDTLAKAQQKKREIDYHQQEYDKTHWYNPLSWGKMIKHKWGESAARGTGLPGWFTHGYEDYKKDIAKDSVNGTGLSWSQMQARQKLDPSMSFIRMSGDTAMGGDWNTRYETALSGINDSTVGNMATQARM